MIPEVNNHLEKTRPKIINSK